MSDLDRALADIVDMRAKLAAGTMFRGLGPLVIAITGGLALAVAGLQSWFPDVLASDPQTLLLVWIATAVCCAGLIGTEMIARSRRLHGGLADAMLINAVENFLPAGVAGAAIAGVLYQFSPETLWLLPGFWQILLALGLFSAVRSLPWSINFAAAWYFLSGIAVLMICAQSQSISPWAMGLPFAIGQGLMALILKLAHGGEDDE